MLTVSRGYPATRLPRWSGSVTQYAPIATPARGPSLSFTTTDIGKVVEIATMLDRLHPVPPGVYNCPRIQAAPTVTFTFRARRGGPVLSWASTLATGPRGACPGITFEARGRARRILDAQPPFLRQAQRVLGAHLMTK